LFWHCKILIFRIPTFLLIKLFYKGIKSFISLIFGFYYNMNIQQQLEGIFNGTGVHLNAKVAESFVAFPYFELGYVANAVLQPREKNAIGNASIILQNDIWLHYLLNHQKINKLQHNNTDSIVVEEALLKIDNHNIEEAIEVAPTAATDSTTTIAENIDEIASPIEASVEDIKERVVEEEATTNFIQENGVAHNEIHEVAEVETEAIVEEVAAHSIEDTNVLIDEPVEVAEEKIEELTPTATIEEPVAEHLDTAIATPDTSAIMLTPIEEPLAFEPYHTVDYFASQGIKLQQMVVPTDKLGQQLKSFTEWLKAMKKVAPKTAEVFDNEIVREHVAVVHLAENSLQNTEIVTETMAEVLIKQGKNEEAITVFQKLSLQDSAKSAYFATRIEQLKSN
jgi:hypothetical protein